MKKFVSLIVKESRLIVQDVKALCCKRRVKNINEIDTLILIPRDDRALILNVFEDILNDKSVVFEDVYCKQINSRIFRLIKRIHFCRALNKWFDLPCKSIWYSYSELLHSGVSYKYILVFANCFFKTGKNLLKIKKYYPKSHMCIFIWNTVIEGDSWWNIRDLMQSNEVDDVLTFDLVDAKKNGWTYTGPCYYSRKKLTSQDITTALYYVGLMKDRKKLINECYQHVSEKASCVFKVAACNEKLISGIEVIEKSISYDQILCDVQTCNCILEIVKEGQTGPTLRYFEAVCYNKKLLTNNSAIRNLPFYDKRYMRVFKSALDIDVDWVSKRDVVDYHYDGRFSPTHLIDLIRNSNGW
jgi:hypothetical protein